MTNASTPLVSPRHMLQASAVVSVVSVFFFGYWYRHRRA